MAAQIAILDSPDTLHLPAEAQAALRLHAGSRIAITIEENRVVLQPADEPPIDAASEKSKLLTEQDEREARARVEEFTNALQSLFAGQPSLEDEYFRTRDTDKW